MSREYDIKNAAWDYFQDLDSHHFHLLPHCNPQTDAFEAGAKWADEHSNKNLVYTKQELMDMGFSFDLNGNISTPQEIEERSKKYINYRKNKWVDKACEWLDKVNTDNYMDSGIFQMSELINDFRKAMKGEL